jgi:hypothetical protein
MSKEKSLNAARKIKIYLVALYSRYYYFVTHLSYLFRFLSLSKYRNIIFKTLLLVFKKKIYIIKTHRVVCLSGGNRMRRIERKENAEVSIQVYVE